MYKEASGFAVLLKKPHRICFLIAGVFLFLAMTSFHSSMTIKDYVETTGEVSEVEEVSVYWHRSYVTRYNYLLTWTKDGEEYEKYFDEQVDPREEGEVTVWVRPDNRDAVFANGVEAGESAYQYLGIGLAAGFIGLLLMFIWNAGNRMSRQLEEEHLENTRLYSGLVFIVCIIGIIIQLCMSYKDYRSGEYVNPVMYDFSIACGVIAAICMVLFLRAGKKLKRFQY
jgi:hypothetical protein